MSDHLKKPLFQQLGKTIRNRIDDASALQGKALPCRVVAVVGNLVTINFEVITSFTLPQVTIPVATSQYVRVPVQVGDAGLAVPADTVLGGITGQSGVTPWLDQPPSNLGALAFLPVSNVGWPILDPLSVVISGPNGVILSDAAGTTTVTVSAAGVVVSSPVSVSMACGSNSVTVTPAGVAIVGVLTINGVPYLTHTHSGVTTGTGVTGPVV